MGSGWVRLSNAYLGLSRALTLKSHPCTANAPTSKWAMPSYYWFSMPRKNMESMCHHLTFKLVMCANTQNFPIVFTDLQTSAICPSLPSHLQPSFDKVYTFSGWSLSMPRQSSLAVKHKIANGLKAWGWSIHAPSLKSCPSLQMPQLSICPLGLVWSGLTV